MSDDATDATTERTAREEQENLDRAHGQHILDITADRDKGGDRLVDAIRRAYELAKADEK